jgi:hypothetical protein
MKIFSNITKRLLFKEPKKILGRWNIETCKKVVDRKIDYSNEDHCGPCGLGIVSGSAMPTPTSSSTPYPMTTKDITVRHKYPIIIYK